MIFAATVPTCVKVVPFVDCSILNPLSLLELSIHAKFICPEDAAVAVRPVGAAGVGVGVGVGEPPPEIWTIFATDGTPFLFRIKSM